MAARLADREQQRLVAQGVGALAPAAALEALGELLADDVTQAAVLAVDWATLLGGGEVPPFLAELTDAPAARVDDASVGRPDVRAELDATVAEDRRAVLDGFVHQQITRVLGLDPREPLDPWQGLTDIGMDSLMAVELSNRLRAGLGLSLPSTLAFEYPTFRALTEHLADTLALDDGSLASASTTREQQRETTIEAIVNLSDEEVERRLLRELEESGY
jgi:acyl carrier protein